MINSQSIYAVTNQGDRDPSAFAVYALCLSDERTSATSAVFCINICTRSVGYPHIHVYV